MTSESSPEARATLKDILAFVDGHVKFAETKNAAILAANAAAVAGIGQVLSGSSAPTGCLSWYLKDGLVLCMLAGVVALLSFLPKTHFPWVHRRGEPDDKDNLYFFGHVQKYGEEAYVKAVRRAEGLAEVPYSPFERMLGNQVLINARIASRKFAYSRVAMWLTLAGVVTPIVAAILFAWLSDGD